MKRINVIVLFVCLTFYSCAQNDANNKQDKQSTNLYHQLKKFDAEPIYQIRIKSTSNYEILVNDIPVMIKHSATSVNNLAEINWAIPKSGKQKIAITLLPETNQDVPQEKLRDNVEFSLSVEKTAWKNGSLQPAEKIAEYSLPTKKKWKRDKLCSTTYF